MRLSRFDEEEASRRIFEAVPRQQDLADLLEISSATLSYFKKKKRCPLELALAASELSGRPMSWFLFGEEETDFGAESRAIAAVAVEAANKSAELARKFRIAETETGYDPAGLSARVELLESQYQTFAAWIRLVEARLGRE